MDADALLRQIAPLPFPERQRRLVEVARREIGGPSWQTLLLGLLTRGAYERRCALLMAGVVRDLDHVRASLGVGGPDERVHALVVGIRLGLTAGELEALLPGLSRAGRQAMIRTVRRDSTPEVADALLPAVRAALGDPAAAGVLPACSPEVVAAHLAGLDWAVTSWAALGHRHPGVVLDHLERTLAATPRALWSDELRRLGAGLAACTPHAPDRVLTVLERCPPGVALPPHVTGRLAVLARHDPERTAALLLRPGAGVRLGRALVDALAALPDDLLGRLLAATARHAQGNVLRHLPPHRRVGVHRIARGEATGAVDLAVLDLLPWPERHLLARAALARHDVADHPDQRLAYVARLPFAEAEPLLAAVTREPTAERRALGYALLLTAARGSRDPAVVEVVLTRLTRLPNEQDPVRVAAVRGVAELPGRWLTAAAADAAVGVAADAVAAPDASWATRAGA
ncbi:hypothetical protein ACXR2U_17660, partial [Jatrophihabitans sp. YIM 134969]